MCTFTDLKKVFSLLLRRYKLEDSGYYFTIKTVTDDMEPDVNCVHKKFDIVVQAIGNYVCHRRKIILQVSHLVDRVGTEKIH